LLLLFQVGAGLLAEAEDLAPGGEDGVGIGVATEALHLGLKKEVAQFGQIVEVALTDEPRDGQSQGRTETETGKGSALGSGPAAGQGGGRDGCGYADSVEGDGSE